MKINPISFLNLNNFQSFSGCNTVKSNNNQQFDYNKTFNSAEILGRSQVNFTSNNDKNKIFQEYDKKFIDTVSQNLRLSDEEKIRFNNDVKDFLKTNKIKSLENLVGAENAEMQAEFIGEVGDDICHSDFDFNILSDAFYDRVYYEGEYKPEVSLYDKDYEVIDHILDKYNCDEGKKCEVFDILKMDATNSNCKNVFELFKKQKDYPNRFMGLLNNFLKYDPDTALDMTIDFGLMSKKSEEERHSSIYPWKMSSMMNEQAKDEAITSEIVGSYDIVDEDFLREDDDNFIGVSIYSIGRNNNDDDNDIEDIDHDSDVDDDDDDDDYTYDDSDDDNIYAEQQQRFNDILKLINKRREGVSVEQIAYEITEKYNLPSDAYDFIIKTIYDYDTSEYEDEENPEIEGEKDN